MTILETIDHSINTTKEAYPENDMILFLQKYISGDIDLKYFTRKNDARQKMSQVKIEEIISEILKQAIKVCAIYDYYVKQGNKEFADKIPYVNSCLEFRNAYNKYDNFVAYVKFNSYLLSDLVKCFATIRYGEGKEYLSVLSRVSIGKISEKIDSQCAQSASYKNVHIYEDTVNKCKEDILSGKQIKKPHAEYSLDGDLYAASDVGVKRTSQEDSVLILTHPGNKDFKLILVSDGMGGIDAGEFASQFVVTNVMKWFESLPADYYEKEEELSQLFSQEIVNIHHRLVNEWSSKHGGKIPGATLTGGIIGKNRTVIANVGDSRTYALKDGKLNQITKDDSQVQNLLDIGELRNKEEMRFHPLSNYITNCIGGSKDCSPCPRMQVIDNRSYDVLMSFSDGICDCLSDEQIQVISRTTPREELARRLVEAAKTTESYNESLNAHISAGKDNETVAVYAPRR